MTVSFMHSENQYSVAYHCSGDAIIRVLAESEFQRAVRDKGRKARDSVAMLSNLYKYCTTDESNVSKKIREQDRPKNRA